MNRGAGMEYFKGYTVYTAWIQINAGTSIPEMLLTAAECEARVGSTSKAIGYLNTLRASRIKIILHMMLRTIQIDKKHCS